MAPPFQADFHIQAPSAPQAYTRLEVRREEAKVVLNKTVDGRYNDGHTGYSEVGVLLMRWKGDQPFREEIEQLESIFKKRFRFFTETYEIPPVRSRDEVLQKLESWSRRFDGPNKMSIVYYGGHSEKKDDSLELIGPELNGLSPVVNIAQVFFWLVKPDTDTLLIFDCCYSARAFDRNQIGRRKFELLTSAPPAAWAQGPKNASSFTGALCDSLVKLLGDRDSRGFTTSELYRHLYFEQPDSVKPLLFDQSPKNFGRIWLRPFPDPPSKPEDPKVTIDLRLHLSTVPNPAVLNDISDTMLYLPHLRQLEFQHLHAPKQQLDEFMNVLDKVQRFKSLLLRARDNRAKKQLREQGIPSPIIRRMSSGLGSPVTDRSQYTLVSPNGDVERRSGAQSTGGPPKSDDDDVAEHEVPNHKFFNLFSVAYFFEFTGKTPTLSEVTHTYSKISPVKRLLSAFLEVPIFFLSVPLKSLRWLQRRLKHRELHREPAQ